MTRRALADAFDIEGDALPRTASAFHERALGGEKRLSAALAELGRLALDVPDDLEPRAGSRRRSSVGQARPAPGSTTSRVSSRTSSRRAGCGACRAARVTSLPMYLRGIRVRLERLPSVPQKDRAKADTVVPFWTEWLSRLLAKHGLAARPPPHQKSSPPGQLRLRFDA